jgi:hypothetical protein
MLLSWLQQQELIGKHMTWWLMKIIFKRIACTPYLGFFGINNAMEFMFSNFWTFLKVLIEVMFVSIHTNFVLLQNFNPHLYYVYML